jgi:hypothetical protein
MRRLALSSRETQREGGRRGASCVDGMAGSGTVGGGRRGASCADGIAGSGTVGGGSAGVPKRSMRRGLQVMCASGGAA